MSCMSVLQVAHLKNPRMWAHLHTLTRTDFRFQLFPSRKPANDFGLFYATFYLNMAESPTPWWIESATELDVAKAEFFEKPTAKRAG